jgi:hypothetical protein
MLCDGALGCACPSQGLWERLDIRSSPATRTCRRALLPADHIAECVCLGAHVIACLAEIIRFACELKVDQLISDAHFAGHFAHFAALTEPISLRQLRTSFLARSSCAFVVSSSFCRPSMMRPVEVLLPPPVGEGRRSRRAWTNGDGVCGEG